MRDFSIGFKGIDVVFHDVNSGSILGRLLSGSVVGSVQITYKAGWGETAAEIPYDLQHAVLMTLEYYYLLREDRNLGITGKQNMQGQGFDREIGLPTEVIQMLDSYKDWSFGRNNRAQRNGFMI
jgi:hypothetical protein